MNLKIDHSSVWVKSIQVRFDEEWRVRPILIHPGEGLLLYSAIVVTLYTQSYEMALKLIPLWNAWCEEVGMRSSAWCGQTTFDAKLNYYVLKGNYNFTMPFTVDFGPLKIFVCDRDIALATKLILEHYDQLYPEAYAVLRSGVRKNERLYEKYGELLG